MPEARIQNTSLKELRDLRSDYKEHAATDLLRFDRLDERISDLMVSVNDLKRDLTNMVNALKRDSARVAWAGWAIAAALGGFLAKGIVPGLTH